MYYVSIYAIATYRELLYVHVNRYFLINGPLFLQPARAFIIGMIIIN